MSGASLMALRPYAFQPLTSQVQAYSRFYSAVRSVCAKASVGRSTVRHVRFFSSTPAVTEDSESYAQKKAQHLISQRIQKLRRENALQWPRLRNDMSAKPYTVRAFVNRYAELQASGELVRLCGRIHSIRKSGKICFIDINQGSYRTQVMASLSSVNTTLEDWKALMGLLLRGDHIEVVGIAKLSSTGQTSLDAKRLPVLLSPALAAVPDPGTLIDDKTKVQDRSLDLLVNRESTDLLRFRADVIGWLRRWFQDRDFLEVQTPILSDYAGGAAARPFLTSATEFRDKELALRIAPELWLKRLVVGGLDKIYELGPAFRNEGLDSTHNPEFTMCEFYSAYTNLRELMSLTENMVRSLARDCASWHSYGKLELPDLAYYNQGFVPIEFIPALEAKLDITFPDLSEPHALGRLTDVLDEARIEIPHNISLNKVLDHLASTYLEPRSDTIPSFIVHHPACLAPLAKSFKCPKTGQLVSARAELFIKGREIANMYEEENDPFEQRRKFEMQVEAREEGQASADEGQAKVDESYIHALEHGLPPTGGWGCGVDRLVMLLSGANRINDVLSFGNLRNVVAAGSSS